MTLKLWPFGFPATLTLIFVVAKLWDAIDWPWLWVFVPLWGPVVLAVAVTVVAVVGLALFAVLNQLWERAMR